MFVHELIELLQQHCRPGDTVYLDPPEPPYDDGNVAVGIDVTGGVCLSGSTTTEFKAPSAKAIEEVRRREREAYLAEQERRREEYLREKFAKHGMDYDEMKDKLP